MELFTLLVACAAFGVCIVGSVFAGAAFRLAKMSEPQQLAQLVGQLRVEVHETDGRVADQDSKMLNWRAEMEGLMEAVEGMLDSVETKRRRISAAASKIGREETGPPDVNSMDPHQLERLARERGLM